MVPKKVWLQALMMIVVGMVITMIVTVAGILKKMDGLTRIPREEGMEAPYEVTLETSDEKGKKENVMLTIPALEYDEDVIEQWFQEGREAIPALILGENQSLDHVDQALNLVTELPGTEVSVSWVSSETTFLDWEGNPGTDIPKEGRTVTLYVTFSCQDQTEEFELQVTVFPDKDLEDSWEQKVQKKFEEVNTDNSSDVLYLPDNVDGKKIRWNYPASKLGVGILFVSVMLAGVLVIGRVQEEKKKEEKKKEQMMVDYPLILNKFTLLLNAGMNTRKALAKVALDYRKDCSVQRAAYEVIVSTYMEMEQGVPEAEAYEHIGTRCQLPAYKTFSTLLVSNLRKGNRELLETMERESVQAFENRKRRAKVLGEKAGTKLLGPMMCMLVIVFVILLVPAWISFL